MVIWTKIYIYIYVFNRYIYIYYNIYIHLGMTEMDGNTPKLLCLWGNWDFEPWDGVAYFRTNPLWKMSIRVPPAILQALSQPPAWWSSEGRTGHETNAPTARQTMQDLKEVRGLGLQVVFVARICASLDSCLLSETHRVLVTTVLLQGLHALSLQLYTSDTLTGNYSHL